MKLKFEFIPKAAIGQNLREKPEWEIIRKKVYDIYNNNCSVCRRTVKLLHAHEVWEWDDKNYIQKLIDIIPVCELCHMAIHYDISERKGNGDEAREHYMKVNKCDYKEFEHNLEDAMAIKQRRNRINNWELDTSFVIRNNWIRRIFFPNEDNLVDFDQQKRCKICNDFYHVEAMINDRCFNCVEEFEGLCT